MTQLRTAGPPPELMRVNTANVEADHARARFSHSAGDDVDFVWRMAGGSDYRVKAKVLEPKIGIFGQVYRIRLSRPVHGYGDRLEVTVTADRLCRQRKRP